MDGSILPELPKLRLHGGLRQEKINADAVFVDWLAKLNERLTQRKFDDLETLFIADSWWRDLLAFEWDLTSKSGTSRIREYLRDASGSISELKSVPGGLKPYLIVIGEDIWIQGAFTFKTDSGQGTGFARLIHVEDGSWKAWTVFTQLERLNFQDQVETARNRSHAAALQSSTNGVHCPGEDEHQVLIVGSGQAGLTLAAQLQHMGLKTLIIDKHPRVGDCWRVRYKNVYLNTPTFTDHYPFIKYPDTYPKWLRRDQVADFMEHYRGMLGLEVLSDTEVVRIQRADASRQYKVDLKSSDGTTRTLTTNHVVLATGVYGAKPIKPHFQGQELFGGSIYHSSEHMSAEDVPNLGDKKIVVIGPGTSGHDIAQDFAQCGAKQVTMVQRHPIFSLSAESWETLQLGLWNMPGISTEEADLVGNSIPLAVARSMSIGLTKAMAAWDKEMLDGLKKAGLAVRTGEDGFGLADHQLIKGGHYYIDQGASQMIIDGRIKVRQCEGGVKEFSNNGLELSNGEKLEADVVVLATGFEKNITTVRHLLGDAVADKLPEFGDLDKEQERSGWWRPTGEKGFWYMTGSFMWCRQYSRILALQIAAIEKSINKNYYTET